MRFARRGKPPLINLKLMRNYGYAIGVGIGSLYFAGFTGLFLVMTLFYQRGLGFSPLDSGAAALSFAIGSAVSAGIGGRYVFRFGRAMIVIGLVLVAIGLAGTALLTTYYTGGHVGLLNSIPLLVAGIGSGIVISPNQTLTLNDVPPAEGGTAAAVLQTGQRIGTAMGTAVAGSLFFGELTTSHGDYHDRPRTRCGARSCWSASCCWRASRTCCAARSARGHRKAGRGTRSELTIWGVDGRRTHPDPCQGISKRLTAPGSRAPRADKHTRKT